MNRPNLLTDDIRDKERPIPPRVKQIFSRARVEDDGESNWLVSYADMMTLLFGFFVMIGALSTPDAGKVEKMKEATAESLGGKYTVPFEELTLDIKGILKENGLEKDVSVDSTEMGIAIVSKGTVFFNSGSTSLNPAALILIKKVARLLVQNSQKQTFNVSVEGHTDDLPIVSKHFPSNWELSASRASTVVRLFEDEGFKHNQLRPVGLADTEPLVPNRDKNGQPIVENQSMNRRIVIRVQKTFSSKSQGTENKNPGEKKPETDHEPKSPG